MTDNPIPRDRITALEEHLAWAWTIIANASDWSIGHTEWVMAAERWRDRYYKLFDEHKESS